MEVLADATMVMILQYKSISNQHVVYLKQYYKSIVSQKAGEKNKTEAGIFLMVQQRHLVGLAH